MLGSLIRRLQPLTIATAIILNTFVPTYADHGPTIDIPIAPDDVYIFTEVAAISGPQGYRFEPTDFAIVVAPKPSQMGGHRILWTQYSMAIPVATTNHEDIVDAVVTLGKDGCQKRGHCDPVVVVFDETGTPTYLHYFFYELPPAGDPNPQPGQSLKLQ